MAFLVEQGSEAVQSNTYRAAREALTGNLEMEAAKQLAKARLERATKKKKGRGGVGSAADSELWPRGRLKEPCRRSGEGLCGSRRLGE